MIKSANLLRIPGPTPIPPSVNRAMTQPMIGHRSEEAKKLFERVKEKVKPVFGTNEDVIILTGSGTSGLEAAIVNTTDVEDEVLVIVTGNFGERFAQICETYQLNVHRLEVEWGEAADPNTVKEYIEKHKNIKAVFVTACETSTGVLNPIGEISQVIRQASDALVIVDGVSSVGGAETRMDEWGVDVYVSGSQKAMMLPPGLCFIAASERAWKVINENERPRFYLDLRRYLNDAAPFTPAVSLIRGLEEAMDIIEAEGIEQVYERHITMMEMTRAAARALGLKLLTTDKDASPTVTTIMPVDFEGDALRKQLKKEFDLDLAGGQKILKGKVVRIGHMGYCQPSDVLQVISLLETGLQRLGKDIKPGQGVAAAQQVYLQAGGFTQ